ncbi:Ig-like domain-containing protein [Rhodococcus sp. NPDC049939]|uniref:Ig-like domain-containing protein n=1 Tax=Rhodococcus sp. NPDC049939 TaxID=3155511 RepID=UPI0033D3088A
MLDRNIRRVVGGVSAVAVAAGFAVTVGAGTAGAASDSVVWNDGNSKFTRTISDVNPAEGDIITTTTKFERTRIPVEYIHEISDWHPTCLEYVSSKVDGKQYDIDSQGDDWAKIRGGLIEWPVYPNVNPKSHTFEFSYRVGPDCDRGVTLKTGMSYQGSIGDGSYKTKGPNFTVQLNESSTTLAPVPSVQVGDEVDLTAVVTGAFEGDTVGFYDGEVKIADSPLNGDGVATTKWVPATKGGHTLTARFAATPKTEGSQSAPQTVQVSEADAGSSTVLAPIVGAQVGQSTVLRATVSPAGAGGTVIFTDGGAVLAEVPVEANSVATYAWVPSNSGDHNIAATFTGRPGVAGSTTSATVNVAPAPVDNIDSVTELNLPDTATVGDRLTITAQVTPGDAGGTVTFKQDDSVFATSSVDASGQATATWEAENEGQFRITAEYSGAGNVNASDDEAFVAVSPVPTETSSMENVFGS